ncbi:MAG: coproporphyrinogen dehydrogenase HemZ [Lachnospiraceae bacterium]|nr:coproporphyrinogen dehydrogenase HemZ [Lachnospiraceae bacterium]
MIAVRINEDIYSYDIHSLVKAFFPAEEVKVFREGETELDSTEGLPELFLYMEENGLRIRLSDGERELTEETGDLDLSERIAYKNELKKALYRILSSYTGVELPWGDLTGIRPTKIACERIKNGDSDEDVMRFMKDTYYVSDEKCRLAVRIAHNELELLKDIDYEKGYSLYIGIPFCPSTCLYCSFTSYPIAAYRKKVGSYIEALKKEIDHVAEYMKGRVPDTVYMGGGTPTTLSADELEEIINYLRAKIDISGIKEFTVEAGRADSITREKLERLRKLGITRISVNPQTMNEETLGIIGRKATAAATIEAYELARDCGHDNINMDLIMGLPNEGTVEVRDTLEKVTRLSPDSLTVHSLAIKRASRLAQMIDDMGYETMKNTDEIMKMTEDAAANLGMEPYYLYRQKNMSGNFENVGYARPGKFGIYNILIMEEVQSIVAIGAGTVSKRVFPDGRIERCDSVKDVNLYIEKLDDMIERKKNLFMGFAE